MRIEQAYVWASTPFYPTAVGLICCTPSIVPPPPLATPPPCNLSPPLMAETVTSMFFWLTYIVLVCVAHLLYAWPCNAFPFLQTEHLCVCRDILSPRVLYGCVIVQNISVG